MRVAVLILSVVALSAGEPQTAGEVQTPPQYLAGGIKFIISEVDDIWKLIRDHGELAIEHQTKDKHETLLLKVRNIVEIIDEVKNAAQIDEATKTLHMLMKKVKKTFYIDNSMDEPIRSIHAAYQDLSTYAKSDEYIESATLVDFAESAVSHAVHSVRSLLDKVNYIVVSETHHNNLIEMISDGNLDDAAICVAQESPYQLLYNLYQSLILTEMKGYIITQFSYMLLKLYGKGNYAKESDIEREKFIERSLETAKKMKESLAKASRHLWACDPEDHKEGETYLEITQLLQGYLQNEVDLNSKGTCKENCAAYQHTKSHSCYQNLYCRKQRRCQGTILDCKFVESDMNVCPSSDKKRRYDYIEYESGRRFGTKTHWWEKCSNSISVESWWRWLFWHCSYCMCLCDEEGSYSDRYISMVPVLSNVTKNMVVTGLKFTKKDRIIHLQIQEGKLLPGANIEKNSVSWVPVKAYTLTDRGVYKDKTYFTLAWNKRDIDLDVLEGREGHVVTGVRFQKIGTHLNFQIQITPFDYATGILEPKMSEWVNNINTEYTPGDKRTRIDVRDRDVPTRSQRPTKIRSTHNQFLEFTHTSFTRDAAQTTVPFFDAQTVRSHSGPINGAGLFFKSSDDVSGGFIGLKVITYNHGKKMLQKSDLDLPPPENFNNFIIVEPN